VRYVSGKTVYVETLVKDCFIGRYWGADGRTPVVNESWNNSAFEIRIKDVPSPPSTPGTLLSKGWRWVSAAELPKTDRGARHFVVKLSSTILPVTAKVHTLLDGTPVLARYLEISNASSKPLALTAVSPWAGGIWSGDAPVTVGHSVEWQPSWEGWFGWTHLSMWGYAVEEEHGLVWDDPYFILHNESTGEYFFGELGWSANYLMEFRNDFFEKNIPLTFKIGPTAINALRVIQPGETIATPAVHLGLIRGDFDEAVQAMHEHIRRSVLPTRRPERSCLIQYLIPEDWPMTVYRGEAFNETNMMKCMDVAAAVGMELFILDGPMWGSAYGNWLVPNQKRFPRGLGPLVEYAHQKGLLFGLYVEPEGGRDGSTSGNIGPWSQSKVFQEHPDWFVQPGTVLNLSIPEAAAYMDSELNQIVDHYKLDLYRHDFNGPEAGQSSETLRDGFMESDYWRHYDAFYSIFEHVHAKYPDLILQQASGGGRRSDLGTVGRFHEQFTSDRAIMPFVYRMLSGFSVFLPPETLVNSNGMAWPKDQPDLDTTLRGAYALGNTPMIFNSILPKSVEELKPEVRGKFLHYANLYKTFIRPILPTSRVYHHAPVNGTGGVESGDWFAMEFTSPDQQKGWATIIRLKKSASDSYLLKPKGLDRKRKYGVTFDNTGKTQFIEGAALMRDGLAIHLEGERASELVLMEGK
jgi:alpha-galactosidase